MNYPKFDLEKALAGAPVALHHSNGRKPSKAFLHISLVCDNYIVEAHDGVMRYSLCQIEQFCTMWQEPVKFDYWHLLNENVTAIKRETMYKWVAIGIMGEAFASYNVHTLKPDFFPECEIGTIIKRA